MNCDLWRSPVRIFAHCRLLVFTFHWACGIFLFKNLGFFQPCLSSQPTGWEHLMSDIKTCDQVGEKPTPRFLQLVLMIKERRWSRWATYKFRLEVDARLLQAVDLELQPCRVVSMKFLLSFQTQLCHTPSTSRPRQCLRSKHHAQATC